MRLVPFLSVGFVVALGACNRSPSTPVIVPGAIAHAQEPAPGARLQPTVQPGTTGEARLQPAVQPSTMDDARLRPTPTPQTAPPGIYAPGAVVACVVMPDGTLLPAAAANTYAAAPLTNGATTGGATTGGATTGGATTGGATPNGAYGANHDEAFVPPAVVVPAVMPAPNTPTTAP